MVQPLTRSICMQLSQVLVQVDQNPVPPAGDMYPSVESLVLIQRLHEKLHEDNARQERPNSPEGKVAQRKHELFMRG